MSSKLCSIVELSPEIQDMILDHLWDDKAALNACSLVCSAWLVTTRYHLFDSVSVTHWDRRVQERSRLHFEQYPRVAAHVRHLTTTDLEMALSLLWSMRGVEHLTIAAGGRSCALRLPSQLTSVKPCTVFSAVRTLDARCTTIEGPDLVHIPVTFPNLATLHLGGITRIENEDTFRALPSGKNPAQRSIKLEICQMSIDAITQLLRDVQLWQLSCICISIILMEKADVDIFARLTRHLESRTINIICK